MRALILQFHPKRAPRLPLARVVQRLAEVAASLPEVKAMTFMRGRDRGPYVDVSFTLAAKHLPKLWSRVSIRALGRDAFGRALRSAAIVYCEGSRGWDNYMLLYHFDLRQTLDRLLPSNTSLERSRER